MLMRKFLKLETKEKCSVCGSEKNLQKASSYGISDDDRTYCIDCLFGRYRQCVDCGNLIKKDDIVILTDFYDPREKPLVLCEECALEHLFNIGMSEYLKELTLHPGNVNIKKIKKAVVDSVQRHNFQTTV